MINRGENTWSADRDGAAVGSSSSGGPGRDSSRDLGDWPAAPAAVGSEVDGTECSAGGLADRRRGQEGSGRAGRGGGQGERGPAVSAGSVGGQSGGSRGYEEELEHLRRQVSVAVALVFLCLFLSSATFPSNWGILKNITCVLVTTTVTIMFVMMIIIVIQRWS